MSKIIALVQTLISMTQQAYGYLIVLNALDDALEENLHRWSAMQREDRSKIVF